MIAQLERPVVVADAELSNHDVVGFVDTVFCADHQGIGLIHLYFEFSRNSSTLLLTACA